MRDLQSATLVIDARRWLEQMEKEETDWLVTETGDMVTDFECLCILGMND